MAQIDHKQDPNLEQLLPVCEGGDEEQGHWPAPMAPTFGHYYGHEDDHDHDQTKKSVLTKVKDKAKKWKQSIFKKKHGHDEDEGNLTPPWGVSLEEDNVDLEQDPEYHGAPNPVYESEMAPDSYKEEVMSRPKPNKEKTMHRPISAHKPALKHLDSFREKDMENQTTSPATADKHVLEGKMTPEIDPAMKNNNGNNKTLTETVTGILAPVYNMASEATQMITSKIQGQIEPNRDELISKQMWDKELVSKQVWDKGISVKEYLMQKLEPGEDEKALSEVISEAMSPRKKSCDIAGEGGMVEKTRGAVSSFLGSAVPDPTFPEEDPESNESQPISNSTKSPPIPVSTNPHPVQVPTTKSYEPIPVSTNVQKAPVTTESPAIPGSTKSESLPLASYPHPIAGLSTSHTNPVPNTCHTDQIEESGGRILQAN